MKVYVDGLIGPALDWAVAKIENPQWWEDGYMDGDPTAALEMDDGTLYSPSTNWSQGGPIIEREKIETRWYSCPGGTSKDIYWVAKCTRVSSPQIESPTVLIAAMRLYVAIMLGDVIDVPEELL